jgi:type VI secretion system protein ImpG
VYVSVVDAKAAPYDAGLKQLGVQATCTNRDLAVFVPVGRESTDFTLEAGIPVGAVRCVSGVPTTPRPSNAEGQIAWRIISHLSLNYLSLVDGPRGEGAAGLRDLLSLYGDLSEAHVRKQIDGVRSVISEPAVRRVPAPGPITFARGLKLSVTFDEASFEGTGIYLLGAVLDRFFAKYVSINSFTQTVVRSLERGEVMQWPARFGLRHIL